MAGFRVISLRYEIWCSGLSGSNCDHDTHHVIDALTQQPVTYLWHASEDLQGCDAILVPGGFAYGDYLRTGAIAKFAPVMQSVAKFAKSGGLVLGICNGFQILCEAGLLPGALMRNAEQHYICKQTYLRTETKDSPFTQGLASGQVLQMPIGHMEGNYFCDAETLARAEGAGPDCVSLCDAGGRGDGGGESKWVAGEYRRGVERGAERAGDDAASGPVERGAAGVGGWAAAVSSDGAGIGCGAVEADWLAAGGNLAGND